MFIDADSHIVEPCDTWVRHIPSKDRRVALAIRERPVQVDGVEGQHAFLTLGRRTLFRVAGFHPQGMGRIQALARAGLASDAAARQQRLLQVLRETLIPYDEQSPEAAWNPRRRLEWMDQTGVEATLLFPTWGLMWEGCGRIPARTVCANARAYNRWILGFSSADRRRLLPAAQVPLLDRQWAEQEIEELARRGVQVLMVRPLLTNGLPLGDASFDWFWEKVETHALGVAFHITSHRADGKNLLDDGWSQGFQPGPANGLLMTLLPHLPSLLTLTSMIHGGVFDRHPRLRIAILEQGVAWMKPWLADFDALHSVLRWREGRRGSRPRHRPSHYIAKHVWFAASEHDAVEELLDFVSPKRLMLSSDYPHPESSPHPGRQLSRKIRRLDARLRRSLLGANAAAFVGREET